jgi:hypothetical protein
MRSLPRTVGLALAVCAVAVWSQRAGAQVGPSDGLQVNYGGVNTNIAVSDTVNDTEPLISVPFNVSLPNVGYLTLMEPPGEAGSQTVSDYLVNRGLRLEFWSDGMTGFPPDLNSLPPLGQLVETGGPQAVGAYFGVDPNAIIVWSIPEPGTLALVGIGLVALFGYGWRGKKLVA